MKIIIAGSRVLSPSIEEISRNLFLAKFPYYYNDEIVCGMARGVDLAGKAWADYFHVPVKEFPADWDQYGKNAGPIRNKQMAEYADALLLIWDGKSRGSNNMLTCAINENLLIEEVIM